MCYMKAGNTLRAGASLRLNFWQGPHSSTMHRLVCTGGASHLTTALHEQCDTCASG